MTPVAVVLDVTSQEEGRVTKESAVENKTSAIELSAETTSAGKPQESFATRIPLYLLITSEVTLRTAIWSKGNVLTSPNFTRHIEWLLFSVENLQYLSNRTR